MSANGEQAAFFGKQLQDIRAESGKIGRNGGHPECDGFKRRVSPGFVIAGEDSDVTSADELFVFHSPKRAGGTDEIGMINDLDRIVFVVQKSTGAKLIEHFIVLIIDKIVGHNGRRHGAFPCVDGSS